MVKRFLLIPLMVVLVSGLIFGGCAAPAPAPAPIAPVPGPEPSPVPTPAPEPTPLPTPVPAFYAGKTITIVCGYGAGGGYDIVARFIAKYWERYIPGHPNIIIQNMPGASSVIAANWLFNKAKPDGLTLGTFQRLLPVDKAFGRSGLEFEPDKFTWIGTTNAYYGNPLVFAVRTDLGFKKDARELLLGEKLVRFAAGGRSGASYYIPMICRDALGSNFRVVTGYESGPEMVLALERGEVDAEAQYWLNFTGTGYYSRHLKEGIIEIPLIASMKKPVVAELADVPTLGEFITDPTWRELVFATIDLSDGLGMPIVGPPGIPGDLAEILRKSLMEMVNDPEFKADMAKANRWIYPSTGEEQQALVTELMKTSPEVVALYQRILEE